MKAVNRELVAHRAVTNNIQASVQAIYNKVMAEPAATDGVERPEQIPLLSREAFTALDAAIPNPRDSAEFPEGGNMRQRIT